MTDTASLWFARIASIPVLLFLPVVCTASGHIIGRDHEGDSFPMGAFLGLLLGLSTAVVLSRRTLFAGRDTSPSRRFRTLAFIAVFELAAWVLIKTWLAAYAASFAS